LSERGIDAKLRTPQGELLLRSRLIGAHNVQNLVVALGVALALELDLSPVTAALANEPGAPGRLERCDGPSDDIIVLVDYAHTPDALGRALDAVRPFARGRVIAVFGCGGDRDKTKRRPMGKAAAEKADIVVVTNDNPRGEAPEAIAAAIVDGVHEAGLTAAGGLGDAGRGYVVELDRARAIRLAVAAARAGEVVLIAGKGHESYQIIGADQRAFDDRAEARCALRGRRNGEGRAG